MREPSRTAAQCQWAASQSCQNNQATVSLALRDAGSLQEWQQVPLFLHCTETLKLQQHAQIRGP